MQELYERTKLVITAFDEEDVIMTSALQPEDPIHVIHDDEPPISF